jgi:hypothetical protein
MTGVECILEIGRIFGNRIKQRIIECIIEHNHLETMEERVVFFSRDAYRNVPYFIVDTFEWGDTLEGHDYWESYYHSRIPPVDSVDILFKAEKPRVNTYAKLEPFRFI